MAAPGPAAFAARRGPATLGAAIRWPPATALPRSPASRERAGLQAARVLQEPCTRGDGPHTSSCWATGDRVVPGTVWTPVPARGRTAEAVSLCPTAAWVCCLRAGNAPRQSLCSAFPAVHGQATSSWHCGGHCATACAQGAVRCPRVLCKLCFQAGWGAALGCPIACANRTPAISPGTAPSESGTRTAGGARDRQHREVSVGGRVGVKAVSFDFPGVYLPQRGGDFLPERKPCLAHALPDAIAPRYARPKVGHCSPAGCQVLSAGQPLSPGSPGGCGEQCPR